MSRLKNLLWGKSRSSSSSRSNLRGQAYDSAVARDPPVKGSYPVAGNGPNVLEEIQRSHARRESRRQLEAAESAAAPIVPRYRDDSIERPRTAPNNGRGGRSGSVNNGRTRSGFSMKSPPSFFSSSRRNSVRSVAAEPLPPIPASPFHTSAPRPREVQTYQPRKAAEAEQYDGGFVAPYAQHNRTDSRASHKSHVDLFEAHSSIRPSRAASQHRTKASGVRNYGEDVADRNINHPRDRKEREPRLDLNSPEFSYLKHVYSPKKRSGILREGEHEHSRASSALGHVLGHDAGSSDDIQVHHRHAKAASVRSTITAPRPGVQYPLLTDAPMVYSYATSCGRDDDQFTNGDHIHNRRGRALSPVSTSAVQDSRMRETLRQPGASDRGRRPSREPIVVPEPKQSVLPKAFKHSASTSRAAPVESTQTGSRGLKEPPPVAPPGEFPTFTAPIQERQASNTAQKQRQRTMSSASQTTNNSNGHASKGSYSAFPSSSERSSVKSPTSTINKRAGMVIEERSTPISLEGVVDLSNTVDTEVITKTLPAVTHEHVTPQRHEIVEERVTREIHTHDVYHRILPVIETEILPTKHYVPSDDGKSLIEISEHDLHKYTQHTITGKPNGNWQIAKASPRKQSITQSIYSHVNTGDEGAEGPVIGLARGEPPSKSRANSFASSRSRARNALEPILSSTKEYMTKDGYPRTEYIWRHPPVFEDAEGRTQPVYIGAGLGDISAQFEDYYSDDDAASAASSAERAPSRSEEGLLFRDSGYGSAGTLPGLSAQRAPLAGNQHQNQPRSSDAAGDWGEQIEYGRVLNHHEEMIKSEGEATKALRRLKQRRSSAASKGKGKAVDMGGVERGMEGLNVR